MLNTTQTSIKIIRIFANGVIKVTNRQARSSPLIVNRYSLSKEELDSLREAERNKKRYTRAIERAMSANFNYFGTLSVKKECALSKDGSAQLKKAFRFLSDKGVKFFCIRQFYNLYSPFSDLSHIHFMCDNYIDVNDWTLFVGDDADLPNCYCKPINSDQLACAIYMIRDIYRTPKGEQSYRSNVAKLKSECIILNESAEIVFSNSEKILDTNLMAAILKAIPPENNGYYIVDNPNNYTWIFETKTNMLELLHLEFDEDSLEPPDIDCCPLPVGGLTTSPVTTSDISKLPSKMLEKIYLGDNHLYLLWLLFLSLTFDVQFLFFLDLDFLARTISRDNNHQKCPFSIIQTQPYLSEKEIIARARSPPNDQFFTIVKKNKPLRMTHQSILSYPYSFSNPIVNINNNFFHYF